MPSFSYCVKEELCTEITDNDKKYACLYGMLLFSKQLEFDGIAFQTENDKVADLFKSLTSEVLKKNAGIEISEKTKKSGAKTYVLSTDGSGSEILLNRYRIFKGENTRRFIPENIDTNSLPAFFIGAFLAAGSMIDPNKEYHLEFVTPYENLRDEIKNLLLLIGINAKLSERKGLYVVYIKESENIEDLLTFTGATMSSLEIMNVKILKDVRNKANRIANCDAANIEKTVAASAKQVEDIEYIQKTSGLGGLSDELREIAEIRLENPELSLRELGQALEKPIGRSGVNHRMKKLSEIADKLRENYVSQEGSRG